MRRPVEVDRAELVVVTAEQALCPVCSCGLEIYQHRGRYIHMLDRYIHLVRRDKRCVRKECAGPQLIFRPPEDLRLALPRRTYGLDVTLAVGERHLRGEALGAVGLDLNARGIPVHQTHVGRLFRDFLAVSNVTAGDDKRLREKLRQQGGIVLAADGVQFDAQSPVLYVAWDALSGQPLYAERKEYRSAEDLKTVLERVKSMDVPIIGTISDKEKGLVPAFLEVFPDAPHQYCHSHYYSNCAKPLKPDLKELSASVSQRAERVREVALALHKEELKAAASDSATKQRDNSSAQEGHESKPESRTEREGGEPNPASADAKRDADESSRLAGESAGRRDSQKDAVQQICEFVRVNSRVTGRAPFDPAELKRHKRLEDARGLVEELRAGEKKTTPQKSVDGLAGFRFLDRLATALEPGWHGRHVAGRVERHTEILRGIAHELSTDPERSGRPKSSLEAETRLFDHLDALKRNAPRSGLGAATGEFIDDVYAFTKRCGSTLFACFDDDRIPPTSNQLEGFFGTTKRRIRQATGEKSTANSPVRNVGNDFILAAGRLNSTSPSSLADEVSQLDPARFLAERRRLDESERPARRRRSMVRFAAKWIDKIRQVWQGGGDQPAPTGPPGG